LKHDPTNTDVDDAAVKPTSGFLTSEPNREDFIVFYATVESSQKLYTKIRIKMRYFLQQHTLIEMNNKALGLSSPFAACWTR